MTQPPSTSDWTDVRPPWENMGQIFGARTAKEHAAHLVPYVQSHHHILDVGCGLGSITADLANLVPQGEVIGLDPNPKTTEAAKEAAAAKGIANITFVDGDAHDLARYESASFDIVHAHQVVQYFHTPVKALTEMRRVLKPGGILALRTSNHLTLWPTDPTLEKEQAWFAEFVKARGGNVGAGWYLHTLVKQADFAWKDIRTGSVCWEFSGPDGLAAWRAGTVGSARASLMGAGYGTAEEHDKIARAHERMCERGDARVVGLDTTILARK